MAVYEKNVCLLFSSLSILQALLTLFSFYLIFSLTESSFILSLKYYSPKEMARGIQLKKK
jgi:hypothetical protein